MSKLQIGLLVLLSCQYKAPGGDDDIPVDDAGACLGAVKSCAGDVLSICSGPGAPVETTTCGWGCDPAGDPHCKRVVPTGGGASVHDLDHDTFGTIAPTFSLAGTIDGGLGTIGGMDATALGVGYALLPNGIAVFRFRALQIGALRLTGTHPIVLAADGDILVDAPIDVTGQCTGSPEIAGAGGGNGGSTSGADGALLGGGNGGNNPSAPNGAGGGGGWGGVGGKSGGGEFGGGSYGDTTISVLRGGGGGGAGTGIGGAMSFRGGGGGGALQLISNSKIELRNSGSINAGGCGGRRGTGTTDEGGGGGAGGTIVLEAPVVIVGNANILAVNGGGGGGGGGGASHDGFSGALTRIPATGGVSGSANSGAGGAGGAGATLDGQPGFRATGVVFFGGGGGGVGRIRINTRTGEAMVLGELSPDFGDPSTTATQGIAVTQ